MQKNERTIMKPGVGKQVRISKKDDLFCLRYASGEYIVDAYKSVFNLNANKGKDAVWGQLNRKLKNPVIQMQIEKYEKQFDLQIGWNAQKARRDIYNLLQECKGDIKRRKEKGETQVVTRDTASTMLACVEMLNQLSNVYTQPEQIEDNYRISFIDDITPKADPIDVVITDEETPEK